MFLTNITRGIYKTVMSPISRFSWRSGIAATQSAHMSTGQPHHIAQGHKQFTHLLPRLSLYGNLSSLFGQRPGVLLQPCRTNTRGNTYQPSVMKRIRKHGWKARLKTKSGIKVILRRKLKGRKLLTHVS